MLSTLIQYSLLRNFILAFVFDWDKNKIKLLNFA